MNTSLSPQRPERRTVGWKIRTDVRKAVRIAAAQDDTTHEEYVERLLVADLAARNLIDPAAFPAA